MEYIRIFNNDSEYQQFKDGDNYITPNICLDREINGIKCTPYTPPPPPVQTSNEIWYTSSDGNIVAPYAIGAFGANIISNTYENGQGIIKFDRDVTSIGERAFYGCRNLTSITIPDSITSIGKYAFAYCSSLTSVTIPDSVTSIGERAFYYCSSLTSITIPDSVTSIGNYAFVSCENLTSITISDSITEIGDSVFNYCVSLTSVTIPDSVTSIGEYAFEGCYSLTSVTIPDSVTSIGCWAFHDCENLTSIYCKPTTPPTGAGAMFIYYISGRKIYVPTASVNAYKTAEYWNEYASEIVGYDF